MHTYDTVTAAVTDLKDRGYTLDFNLQENCIICNDEKFDHEEFEIMEVYRFEGDSDPADEAIVYGIISKTGVKGILVNGYGPSADQVTAEMAQKLNMYRS